jgi:hypothetical protein
MAETRTAVHPTIAIVKDPLQEEARRNRRALLAVSSVCLAIRLTHAFPTQIAALGITFSTTNQRYLIFMAIALQAYLAFSFFISSIADRLQWRHEMHQEFAAYMKTDEATGQQVFSVESAFGAGMDALAPWRSKAFRTEAPVHRISHEVERYMNKQIGLYRMLLITYPYVLVHHLLLFWFPFLLFLVSIGFLTSWVPAVK